MAQQINNARPVIVVFGATGKQGGAVLDSLAKSERWTIRAITRDISKVRKGEPTVQWVQADMQDRESLRKAMAGDVHGVFSVQNFWEAGYDGEVSQGKLVADVAKERGVKHFIYSTLPGGTGIGHCDSKAEIAEYIRSIGLPATFVVPWFFYDNWNSPWMCPSANPEGVLVFKLPLPKDAHLPKIACEDIGKAVAAMFSRREEALGKTVTLVGDFSSGEELASLASAAIKRGCAYEELPLDLAGDKDVLKMWQFYASKGKDVEEWRKQSLDGLNWVGQYVPLQQWFKDSLHPAPVNPAPPK